MSGVGTLLGRPALPTSKPGRASRLFKDSRQLLAIARAQGRHHVTLLVSTVPGGADAVAHRATQMGGDVRYRADDVGYLRIRLPIDSVSAFAEFDRIESAALDVNDSYPGRLTPDGGLPPDPAGRVTASDTASWPPRWSDYPLQHPYSPLGDIDAARMREQHPTFDGRGVTIALIDDNPDILLPEFQTAYTLDGTRVPKMLDVLNMTDPRDDSEMMARWVDMRDQVVASTDRHVSVQEKMFTMPHDGAFRIGFFNPNGAVSGFDEVSYALHQIERGGGLKGNGAFGVLWDEKTNDVWVDTDRDLDFSDEKAMTDYTKRQDVGRFGTDSPATPERESTGFTIQTDARDKFISVNVSVASHATNVLGSVIGNREPHGRLQGIAPGARLVSMSYGGGTIAHALVEAMISAFRDPRIDVIAIEQNVYIAGQYLLADAHHPINITAQRLTEEYQKLLFVPGMNAPGLGIVSEEGVAPNVISVGGYENRESYRINTGFVPEAADNMHWGALSHGPSGTGALKPDLLAPSGQMSTRPGYLAGSVFRGLFELPPGYGVDGGSSAAAPMAAGAAALVISAAKQTHVPFNAVSLKAALTGSARYIPRLAAFKQGNGLIQVDSAYELLNRIAHAPTSVTITSRAPVQTCLSHLLPTPGYGVGLYEREGWSIGERGTRTISFTRTSGPAKPMTFTLSWKGDDSTFRSAGSISLPLNKAVDLPVTIAVSSAGPHSAILTLDNPFVAGHAYRVLNTVIAPFQFTAANKFTITENIALPRPGDRGIFVDVPAGVSALNLSATSPVGDVPLTVVSPSSALITPCPRMPAPGPPRPGKPCAIPDPEPGVWQIDASMYEIAREFDPDRPVPVRAAPVRITATLIGVEIAATTSPLKVLAAGDSRSFPVTLTNRFAPVSASVPSAALGSAFHTRRSIAQGEQQMYDVAVPEGATSLHARVSDVADSSADLDIYLLDCTQASGRPGAPPNCAPKAKSSSVGPGGEVEVLDPAAGRWVVVVDAYSVPGGHTTYSYVDLFTHPAFGTVAVSDVAAFHASASSWTVPAHVWVASMPKAPRTLEAWITATSPDVRKSDESRVTLGGGGF